MTVRRVVTGHDASGKAIVVSDGVTPVVTNPPIQKGLAFHEVWSTDAAPAPITETEEDPTLSYIDTAPKPQGSIIRIVDLPPEGPDGLQFDKETAREVFSAVGLAENAEHVKPGRHPLMHRTESIDYGIVLSGEVYLLLDDEEVHLKAGDIVVQRGTIHAWSNRSDEFCRIAFILVDGVFDLALAAKFDS